MAKFLKKVFKSKEPPMIEEKRVEYEINKHCKNCPNEIERCIKKEKGVATVRCLIQNENDEETGRDGDKVLALVQGRFDEKRLQRNLWRKTSKISKIVSSQIVESGGGGRGEEEEEDGKNINEGGGEGGGSNSDGDNINEEDDNVNKIGSKIKGVSMSSRKGKEIDDNVSEAASISSHGSGARRGSKARKRSNIASSSHVGKSADVGNHESSP